MGSYPALSLLSKLHCIYKKNKKCKEYSSLFTDFSQFLQNKHRHLSRSTEIDLLISPNSSGCRRGLIDMVVGFTTTCAFSVLTYRH